MCLIAFELFNSLLLLYIALTEMIDTDSEDNVPVLTELTDTGSADEEINQNYQYKKLSETLLQ